jgi:hypothetical protein
MKILGIILIIIGLPVLCLSKAQPLDVPSPHRRFAWWATIVGALLLIFGI